MRFLQASGERHQAVERRVGVGGIDLPPLRGDDDAGGRGGRARPPPRDADDREPDAVRGRHPRRGARALPDLDPPAPARHAAARSSPRSRPRSATTSTPGPCSRLPTTPSSSAPRSCSPIIPSSRPRAAAASSTRTEIEEALLLHVHALSDAEREEIAAGDPAVREMVERALASTPEDIVRLHGLMRPADQPPVPPRPREEPATERETTIDGRTFRLGDRLVLRLAGRIDTYDRMLDGRTATLERIYHRLRRQGPSRRHDRRRPRAGADARDGPLPFLLRGRGRARPAAAKGTGGRR